MVHFIAIMHRFQKQGEKTGWTYIEIPANVAEQIKPRMRKGFRVKGKLDQHKIAGAYLQPVGDGTFILPINADMRKGTGKKNGAMLKVQLTADDAAFVFNKDFMECLADEPSANEFFQTLTGTHQRYFSKWIDNAKTEQTRAGRIAEAITSLGKKWGYPEMLRSRKTREL